MKNGVSLVLLAEVRILAEGVNVEFTIYLQPRLIGRVIYRQVMVFLEFKEDPK